jgi:glycosyltransferase involved in cell wall biosynthesis
VKILHIITRLELGGAQQNTLFTCRALADRGHDVVLASGTGGHLDEEARRAPFRWVPLRWLVREVAPLRDSMATAEIFRLVRRERPDVVHLHSSKAGVLGRVAAWLARAPVVIHSIHGWSFADGMPVRTRKIYRLVERLCAPLTDWFIAVSRRDLEAGINLGIVPASRASVIRSGFDLVRFAPDRPGRARVRAEWNVAGGEILVVTISNFKPQKAPLDFVRAAAAAARREPRLRFAFVGDGTLRRSVEEAVAAEGLAGRLVLAGWRDDVDDILRACDVFVMNSLWEGLPRSVVQARAAGRAVVATAVNGTPEVVEHGETGFLVAPHDIPAMADAIVLLAQDAELRARMGAQARLGLEAFSQDLMVDQQEQLYLSLVSRP